MKDQKHARRGLSVRVILWVLAAFTVVTMLAVSGIYAKYVYDSERYGMVTSPNFYFESDLLKKEGAEYILNAGTDAVTFTLTNSADALRYSDEEIAFTVTATAGTLSTASGTLASGGNHSVTVTLSNLEDGATYTVTAIGTAGFQEKLSATFTVEKDEQTVYMHADTSDPAFVVLTVWTRDLEGNITVTVPAGLIPDNTDPVLRDLTTKNENQDFTYSNLGKYSSVSFRFFVGTWDKNTAFIVKLTEKNGTQRFAKVESVLN